MVKVVAIVLQLPSPSRVPSITSIVAVVHTCERFLVQFFEMAFWSGGRIMLEAVVQAILGLRFRLDKTTMKETISSSSSTHSRIATTLI